MLLLVGSLALALAVYSCSIGFSYDSEETTTATVNRNGEDFRLTVWAKRGPILSKHGWSRSVDRGDGWQVLEKGSGLCPYSFQNDVWTDD